MKKFLIKIANIELIDEDWEAISNIYDGTDFKVLVERNRGVNTNKGYLVTETNEEPSGYHVKVLAKMYDDGDGALWDQMMPPVENEDNIPKATDKDKLLLSHGEKVYLCKEEV